MSEHRWGKSTPLRASRRVETRSCVEWLCTKCVSFLLISFANVFQLGFIWESCRLSWCHQETTGRCNAEPCPCFTLLGGTQDTFRALAPCGGLLHSRPARHLSAVHDAGGSPEDSGPPSSQRRIRRELPSLYKEALGEEKGKNNFQLGSRTMVVRELPKLPLVNPNTLSWRHLAETKSLVSWGRRPFTAHTSRIFAC
jgi:hypothetical protein